MGLQVNTQENDSGFKPYSLRRGGATSHFIACGSLDVVMLRGRWAQARTARVYITTAMLALSESSFSPQVDALMSPAISQLRLPSS